MIKFTATLICLNGESPDGILVSENLEGRSTHIPEWCQRATKKPIMKSAFNNLELFNITALSADMF